MNLQADDTWPGNTFSRWGAAAIGGVVACAVVTGGGASDRGVGDALTQLLALPLLVWATWVLARSAGSGSRIRAASIAAAALVFATVAIQLLPMPETLWNMPTARDALAVDLDAAGVELHRRWSLSPLATERALWSLLPALAVFLGTLAIPLAQRRRLLLLVVALAAASLLLGYLQLGAPQDSLLNPFPQWTPALNGFFANPNHQAMLATIAVITVATLLYDDHGRETPALSRRFRFGLAVLALLMFISLPLTGSRAVMLIAVLGLAAVPLLVRKARQRDTAPARAWLVRAVFGALALATIAAAIGWLRYDIAEEVRWNAAIATAEMGTTHAPWGAGVGSFVAWFDQAAPVALVQREYFNHAHDEFAQWWLESGVLGILATLAALALLLAGYPRRDSVSRRERARGVAVAAWLGCTAILLHSAVDYPLRTPALMTVSALLAGILFARSQGQES